MGIARANNHSNLMISIEIFLWVALITALDQIAKVGMQGWLMVGDRVPVVPGFFDLTLVYNKGAAFGMFSGIEGVLRPILLWLSTALAIGLVSYLLIFEYWSDRVGRAALALVAGGALGNIIDRARVDQVTDFLLVYYNDWHWPAFNVADSAICIGVALLIFKRPKRPAVLTEEGTGEGLSQE